MNKDFNILYHSAPPMADTGYGTHTRNLLNRMKDDFSPSVHSVGGWEGMGIDWKGIDIFPSGGGKHGELSIPYWYDKADCDVVFSHHDHWSMWEPFQTHQRNGIPMVLYTILDHDLPDRRPPKNVVLANEHAHKTVVMSEWAEERILNSRIPESQVTQIPHGVNCSKYAPVTDDISQAELKRELGVPEECFLFGMVAANYGPRKNIPSHMQAFAEFVDEYDADDAYLYIHTHPTMSGGYNLYEVREALDLDRERVILPDPHEVYHGIEDLMVVQLYNTYDVTMNVSQSESWGLAVTESMSCGTPVIGSNFSAVTEQFGVDYDTYVTEKEGFKVTDQGLLVHRGSELWTQNANARRFVAKVEDIKDAMAYYYENRDEIEKHGKNGRDWVLENYEWDKLYEEQWKPFFEEVEDDLKGDYNKYYFERRAGETQSEAFIKESHEVNLRVRGDTVLDVGAGTGQLAVHLMSHDFDVTAVENAEAGVEFMQDREEEIEAYQGDARDLQFKDDSYDTVVSQHVLEHIDADAQALSEMYRVAAKKIICIVPGKGSLGSGVDETEHRRYDSEELDRLNEEFGSLTGEKFEYEPLTVAENAKNWIIEIEL